MDQGRPARRTALYPPIEPHARGLLEVDSRHRIAWEVSGCPQGTPVLFLHGGPGAGTHAHHRRYFDPRHYRIVLFDQRGAGRSQPLGEVADNTTAHLLADIEALRAHLNVERWLLFGGSWGSSLALAYAEAHPERVLGLVLRGIFLCRRAEIDWFLYGMRTVYPEAWRRFAAGVAESERDDLLGAYHRRLADPDPAVHMPAARTWAAYEGACSTLRHNPEVVAEFGADRTAYGLARLEAHYFAHGMFMEEGRLLRDVDRLAGIPAVIVQGRYDMVCPIHAADELVRAWPGADGADGPDFQVIPDAGHAASEPGTRAALIAATERFKSLPA